MLEVICVLIMIPVVVMAWVGAAAIFCIFRRDFFHD
jgi:hypothetical protein